MNITLCASIAFYDDMLAVKHRLEALGHTVKLPPSHITDEKGELIDVREYYNRRKTESSNTSWIWDRKQEAMTAHFDKVAWSDAILVLNYTKNGVEHYVGANTLLEMGLALHLNKKIFLFNPIPDISYREEILGMKPTVINGDLTQLTKP